MSMYSNVLPEFQEYLRSKSLVNEKYIPYYAYWASNLLAFSNRNEYLNHDLRVDEFLNQLMGGVGGVRPKKYTKKN
jgi:hypothetical protein